eukprot:9218122-Karenia_brevis.AAC.1
MHALSKNFEYKGFLTCADPEFSSPTGGVATISKQHVEIIKIVPNTLEFQKIMHDGRVQISGIVLPSSIVLFVVNIYGWTNGHTCEEAALRTEDMIQTIFNELKTQPKGP